MCLVQCPQLVMTTIVMTMVIMVIVIFITMIISLVQCTLLWITLVRVVMDTCPQLYYSVFLPISTPGPHSLA